MSIASWSIVRAYIVHNGDGTAVVHRPGRTAASAGEGGGQAGKGRKDWGGGIRQHVPFSAVPPRREPRRGLSDVSRNRKV